MEITDRQDMLWDDIEELRLRRRNKPLDGHPQEWNAKYYIIKLTIPTGREFYVWEPGTIWTEEIEGAYRYSFTKMGRHSRDMAMREAGCNADERGVYGKMEFEVIDGQQDILKRVEEREQNERSTV